MREESGREERGNKKYTHTQMCVYIYIYIYPTEIHLNLGSKALRGIKSLEVLSFPEVSHSKDRFAHREIGSIMALDGSRVKMDLGSYRVIACSKICSKRCIKRNIT